MRRRDSKLRRLALRVGGAAGALLLRLLGATWRVRVEGDDPFLARTQPFLGALWHRSMLPASYCYRDRGIAVMISRSRDGDWIAAALGRLGFPSPPRGSSSRAGGEALRTQIRQVQQGRIAALLCDGPRGPARHAKPGAIALARATGAPLWPVAFSARPCLRFGSWDRAILPLPFARVLCTYGKPLEVAAQADDAALEQARAALEAELNRLTADLDARLGQRGV